jgi:hypothetical protein
MRQKSNRTFLIGAAACTLAAAVACDPSSGIIVGGPGGPTVQELIVAPAGRTVAAGATLQYAATALMSDGDTANVTVSWSATGGTITTGGLFTAGQAAGVFRVVGRAGNGVADTVSVNVAVPSTNPTLLAVVVTPATATVAAGGTAQFAATGQLSNGSNQAVSVAWTSTGGIISSAGLYTAGALPGTFSVVATAPGGLADTSAVTITGPGTP